MWMKYSKRDGCKRPWLYVLLVLFLSWPLFLLHRRPWAVSQHREPGWVRGPDGGPWCKASVGLPGLSWMLGAAKEVLSPGMLDCSQQQRACCMRWKGLESGGAMFWVLRYSGNGRNGAHRGGRGKGGGGRLDRPSPGCWCESASLQKLLPLRRMCPLWGQCYH